MMKTRRNEVANFFKTVIPAKAGIHRGFCTMDSGLRRNDSTFSFFVSSFLRVKKNSKGAAA